jgi:hypothetical protein
VPTYTSGSATRMNVTVSQAKLPGPQSGPPLKLRRSWGVLAAILSVSLVNAALLSQPESTATVTAPEFSATEMPVDFGTVEALLAKVGLEQNGIRLDSALDAALTSVVDAQADWTPSLHTRWQTLLAKSWPRPAAEQLMQLLSAYRAYRLAESRLPSFADPAAPTLNEELRRFDAVAALRQRYFAPATASKLFGAQQELARYTLALRQLEADGSLSIEKKAELQRQYQEQFERAQAAGFQSP